MKLNSSFLQIAFIMPDIVSVFVNGLETKIEFCVICIILIRDVVMFHYLSQTEHVDVELKKPEDGALRNLTTVFCTLRFTQLKIVKPDRLDSGGQKKTRVKQCLTALENFKWDTQKSHSKVTFQTFCVFPL